MRELFRMDLKDYELSFYRYKRPSVRGVIIKENKVAMVYSRKYDYYKFPGGGIESGEDIITALKREILEETGLTVLDGSVKEFGSVMRIQKSRFKENEIFEQENFYYLCQTDGTYNSQDLDKYEDEEGFELQYVYPKHAILVNRTHDHADYDLMLIERESKVLECLIKEKLI